MKKTKIATAILLLAVTALIICLFSQDRMYDKAHNEQSFLPVDTAPSISTNKGKEEILATGFTREYSKDSTLIYEIRKQVINGCQKTVAWKSYSNKELQTEWHKEYATDSNQTCDFSAYILYQNDYKNGKLERKSQFFAGSDQSEEEPCGNWMYYDSNGNITKTVKYGKCDISKFGRN